MHVSTDLRAFASPEGYAASSIMLVFAADGSPPLVGTTPAVVAMVRDRIVEDDGELRFAERSLEYVFTSGSSLSTPAGRTEPKPAAGPGR